MHAASVHEEKQNFYASMYIMQETYLWTMPEIPKRETRYVTMGVIGCGLDRISMLYEHVL